MNFQKSILILKPGIESNENANEHDSESDAVELFKRDARMHICKYKHHENRNNILKNRLVVRKQLQSNPYLDDIVRKYDDYYEEFKTKITMQIGALERLLKYLKDLEASKSKCKTGDRHYHNHNHYHYDDAGAHEDDLDDRDEQDEEGSSKEHDESSSSYGKSVKMKRKAPIVAAIKKDQKMIFKEIRNLKNVLQMKGSKRQAKYKELSKYIDKIDGETNKTDSNLFKIKREQEQILQTLGEITKDVKQTDKL
uniref:Uncharacterized protein n=1 Tax=viral metagenome TaxID=1070528 RepID=A0A6C0EZT4_9ZZZZ